LNLCSVHDVLLIDFGLIGLDKLDNFSSHDWVSYQKNSIKKGYLLEKDHYYRVKT